ncbi:MAG TPA: hypothetical protein VJV79_17045 [Polyangiaceae bacterium]|nr:hypothetical protein [Polyangiaceae bacterium]
MSFGSARFQYHARADDLSVGPSVLELLEGYGVAADALLGLSPTDHLPIAYYKYRDLRDLQEQGPCGEGYAGCEFKRSGVLEVHSPLSVDEHELTHAYAAALGAPPEFLVEGIASSFSCYLGVEDRFRAGERPRWLDRTWAESLFPEQTLDAPFSVFTTWLLDSFGVERFKKFYGSLARTAGPGEVAAAFFASYQTSLDSAWMSFVTAPSHRLCLAMSACAAEPALGSVAFTTAAEGFRAGLPILASGVLVSHLDLETPVVRACSSQDALPGFYGYWPLLPHRNSVFLPGRQGYVLAPRNRALTPGYGDLRSLLDVQAAGVSDGSTDCSTAQTILVDGFELGVVLWSQPDLSFRLSSNQRELRRSGVRIEALDPGDAVVEVCGTCSGGQLGECSTVLGQFVADGPAEPWIRVHWNAPNNGLLVLGVGWRI